MWVNYFSKSTKWLDWSLIYSKSLLFLDSSTGEWDKSICGEFNFSLVSLMLFVELYKIYYLNASIDSLISSSTYLEGSSNNYDYYRLILVMDMLLWAKIEDI